MNDSGRITATLACLADPSRYKVLSLLVAGDYCVTEIAARVGLSQSCTTRHLQILQRAGVLTRTRMGKRVLFRIREGDPELDRMLELVVLRRPLETAPTPPNPTQAPQAPQVPKPKPPRRSQAARPAPKPREWVPIAHRSRATQTVPAPTAAQTVPAPSNETIGGSRPNALTIAPSKAGESPAAATPALDTPSAAEEAVVPAVDSPPLAAAVELEDYLL